MADEYNIHTKKSQGRELGSKVEQVITNHSRAKAYYQRQIDNQLENWHYYYGKFPELGLGQYRSGIAADLLAQGRQLLQYNFIKPTVDTLAGSLLRTKFDPDFIPLNGEITSLTEACKLGARSDKEIMDWNPTLLDTIIGGLIAESAMKMIVSDKYSDLGNIGIEYALPGSTIPDPLWKTSKSTDCRRVWHESWLTASQMMRTYPEQADLIQFWATRELLDGREYGSFSGITPFDVRDNQWGNVYRIIEEYCVIDKELKVAYLRVRDERGKHTGEIVNIPENVPDEEKGQWLDGNYRGWKPEDVRERMKYEPTCYLRSACPTLLQSQLLQGEKKEVECEVQTGGTPWKFYASSRHNGEPHGIVDAVKDAQNNINYDSMMVQDKLATEGSGGALLAHPNDFETEDETGGFNDFVKNRNNKHKIFKVKDGIDLKGVLLPVVSSKFPAEVYKNIEHLISVIWPRISKVTPASVGMPEQEGMSGKLYNMLKVQADNAAYTLHESLRNFYNDLYESYLKQFTETYGNEDVERRFVYDRGREKINVNERITLDDGTEAMRNQVQKLREIRHLVLVSDKPESPSQEAENVDMLSKLIEVLSPNPANATTVKFLTAKLGKNLSQLNSEDRNELNEIQDKEMQLAETELDIKNLQAQGMKREIEAKLAGGGQSIPGAEGAAASMPPLQGPQPGAPQVAPVDIPPLQPPQAGGA